MDSAAFRIPLYWYLQTNRFCIMTGKVMMAYMDSLFEMFLSAFLVYFLKCIVPVMYRYILLSHCALKVTHTPIGRYCRRLGYRTKQNKYLFLHISQHYTASHPVRWTVRLHPFETDQSRCISTSTRRKDSEWGWRKNRRCFASLHRTSPHLAVARLLLNIVLQTVIAKNGIAAFSLDYLET